MDPFLPNMPALMRLSRWRSDFSFHRDEATRWLPWIMAAMVFLTLLLMLCALSVNSDTESRMNSVERQAVVHIPATAENKEAIQREALQMLRNDPSVFKANPVSQETVTTLLSPWLGSDTALASNLPLPVMIDVTLKTKDRQKIQGLEQKLHAMNEQISFEDHASWMEDFQAYQDLIRWVGIFIVGLLLCVLAGVVVFASVTALKLHQEEVGLLHSLGADQHYIVSQFQMQMAQIAAKGVVVGSLLAAFVFTLLGWVMPEGTTAILAQPEWSLTHLVIWGMLMASTWLLSLSAARLAVGRRLAEYY